MPNAPSRTRAAVSAIAACLALPTAAEGAPWVYRGLTLPRSDWAFDVGLGVGHSDQPREDATGLGLNLALRAGLTSFVQLGVRTGVGFGMDGRLTRADQAGRPFETETYGAGGDRFANPEVSLRWAVSPGRTLELALESRVVLPFADGSHVTWMLALPVALHLGSARIDSGVYVPITFADETHTVVSVPLHLWFQLGRTFLGPLTGVRFHSESDDTSVPLGFGLGHALSYDLDLKTWILFLDVSGDGSASEFGVGVGLELRI